MFLSEISENTMNSQKGKHSFFLLLVVKKDIFVDLSCKVHNVLFKCNSGDKVILSLTNNHFSVDMSESFNPYASVSSIHSMNHSLGERCQCIN